MKIALKCRCGSEVVFEDERGAYCKGAEGASPSDDKGRRYLVEVRADEWQERHKQCLTAIGFVAAEGFFRAVDDARARTVSAPGAHGFTPPPPAPPRPRVEDSALAPHNVDDVMQLVFKYGATRVDVDRSNSATHQRACNEAIEALRTYLRGAGVKASAA